MPDEWKLTLQNSSITLNERIQNPQAVIDALDFYHYQQKKNSLSKYMYSSEKSKFFFFENKFILKFYSKPKIYIYLK